MIIDKDDFKKFQMENTSSSVILTCIRCNYDVIASLLNEGYSLQLIYDYLAVKKGVLFGYRGFCRAWKNFNNQKTSAQQNSVVQPKNKQKTIVSPSTKTQFFEHNASPTEEDIALLVGD